MNINEMTQSKYLKKEEAMPELTVTISGLTKENLAHENEPAENKFVLHFNEQVKPMVLNSTNAQLIAMATGSSETDDWTGKKITLWNDPSVSFGGKMTGGIRVRPTPSGAQEKPQQFDERNPPSPFI